MLAERNLKPKTKYERRSYNSCKILNAILNQQGFTYKKNAVLQTLEDFDNDDYDDIEDMTKNVNVYIQSEKKLKYLNNG
jgi:hypothetical protein